MSQALVEREGAAWAKTYLAKVNPLLLKCECLQLEIVRSSHRDYPSRPLFAWKARFHLWLRLKKKKKCVIWNFFDMTIPGIIRYIKNNETPSVSKYILSSYYPPSVPFKCHLWSVPLFISKKTFSLFFFKVVESILNLCVELRQVTPKLKCSKPLFWKAQVVPIKSVRRTFSFQNLACSSGNVRCALI